MKKLVLRIRKRYFDAIVSGEKITEFRADSPFWRSRIDGKSIDPDELWIAVFICGKRIHRREITLIQKVETPSFFSAQGKKDVSSPLCYAIHLGKVYPPPEPWINPDTFHRQYEKEFSGAGADE